MKINKINIELNDKLIKLDGIRILHISDLHVEGRDKKIEKYMDILKKVKCDLILITGDLIDNNKGIEWCVKYIKKLHSRYGVWTILGNHDKFDLNILYTFACKWLKKPRKNNISLLNKKLHENGIQTLINQKKTIIINSVFVTLIGTDVPFGLDRFSENRFVKEIFSIKKLFSKPRENEYIILLNHVPELLKYLGKININLALCGHTHGGQIRLPFIGPIITYSSFQRKFNRGLYKYNGYCLNISAGLGVSKPISVRLFCPPEATLIYLKKKKVG